MRNKLFHLYATVISILAIISVLLLVGDYNNLININSDPWSIVNYGIWIIFVVDYVTRFYLAKHHRTKFFFHNIFDLLAIIPFDLLSSFRIFRVFRLVRFFRAFRMIGFIGRLIRAIKHFLKVTGLNWVLTISTALVVLSAVLYSLAEKVSFGNSLWWAIVTTTTVGYGDIAPTTLIGRCVAVFLMFTGIGVVGILTSAITNYFNKSNSNSDDNTNQIHKINTKLNKIENENKILNHKLDKISKNMK